jgi:hypothetical protein
MEPKQRAMMRSRRMAPARAQWFLRKRRRTMDQWERERGWVGAEEDRSRAVIGYRIA